MPPVARVPHLARSLRVQLTAAAAVVMAVALALASVLLVVRLHHSLLGSVDSTVRQRVAAVTELVRSQRLTDPLPTATDEEVVQVTDAAGRVIAGSRVATGDIRPQPLPTRPAGAVRAVSGTSIGGEADSYRLAAATVAGPAGPLHVVAAVPSDDVADSIHQLAILLALGLPAVLAVLVGMTWTLVGRALHPVEILRRQAAAISGHDLDRRVDIPRSSVELERLARTLNELLERADRALERQRAFVGDAAHELRTPLAALLTRLDVQERQDRTAVQAAADADADLRPQVLRMSRLVDDLLTLARVDARPPRLVPVDFDDVVLAELAAARELAAGAAGRITLSAAVAAARVCGDAAMLGRVVRNLLDNAIRHAQGTVRVSLDVQVGNTDPSTGPRRIAVLGIADDGPGIAPADTDRIFERFTRLQEGRDRDTGGAGLGLAIVRDVVEAHGGRVTAEPCCVGARFVVRLPLDSSAAASG
ncbi:MAG: hypothetical protein QOC80_36 [Frankiaceae bacterium]|nr:hypothetical protein [Frankiaceae bacterium]